MFKHRVNGASRDRVYRASSACVACPDGSPLKRSIQKKLLREYVYSSQETRTVKAKQNVACAQKFIFAEHQNKVCSLCSK